MPGVMTSNDTLEDYRDAIGTQDTHKKLKIADDLIEHLNNSSSHIHVPHACQLIDGLQLWASSSNFKVSQKGLEILGLIADRVGSAISKGHITSVLAVAVDRLGDSKQVVRDQSMELIFKFMDPVSSPQNVFEILSQYFNHKNWRVREVLMICLTKAINEFDASSIQINKLTPHLVKLLSDPTGQVRDTAVLTMVEVYRHIGERFSMDIRKRNIPEAKLNEILAKFDRVQTLDGGKLSPQTDVSDDVPNSEKKKSVRSAARRSASFAAGDKKRNAMPERGVSAGSSGALDETDFMTAWEEVQDYKLFSIRDFPTELEKVKNILSNTSNDWEKRVDALRQLRSLAKISNQVNNFPKMMKDLEIALRESVKDLRSSVVRDACITLSYLSYIMENKFEFLAESLLPSLIILIPNSVKIMSSSGHAVLRLIIKNTQTPRLIPIIISHLLTAKSKEIRRRCADYLGLLLELWPTSVLKSHVSLIEEAIRKGVSDADSEARAAVRRAYWHFADHYQSRSDSMMQSFDASKQKLLQSDKNLISAGVIGHNKPTRASSNIDLSEMKGKKKAVRNKVKASVMPPPPLPSIQRSSSQLEYKHKAAPPNMTPRQKSYDDMKRNAVRAAPREGRTRFPQRSAASQPSSRTGSPKRLMPTMTRERSEDYMKTYSTLSTQKTRIPTPAKPTSRSSSQTGSRDISPTRLQTGNQQYDMRRNGSQSDVTEDALWSALKKNKTRDGSYSQNSVGVIGSDESDTSSQSSHNYDSRKCIIQDYDEILKLLQQDSTGSKRDGLHSVQVYLNGMNALTTNEARCTKDIFNRYFAEPNSKVYSLFLDVLSEFIVQYKNELQDWLFILLTRLLHRISSEVLSSSQTKIAMVLDVVRDSYPYDHQFQIITKYITDNTQVPSIKMKVKLLQYLTGLIALMDASDFTNIAPIRLAVSRIVTWISEPKSPEVRKEATAVIIALFQLNSPEFSMLLSSVPNSIQEGATRVIQVCLKTGGVPHHEMAALSLNERSRLGSNSNTRMSPLRKGSAEDYNHHRTESPTKIYNKLKKTNSYDNGYPEINAHVDYLTTSPREDFVVGGEHIESSPPRVPTTHNRFTYNSPEIVKENENIAYSPQTPTNNPPQVSESRVWLTKDTTSTSYNPKQYEDSLLHSHFDSMMTPDFNREGDGAEHPDAEGTTENSKQTVNLFNEISTVLSSPKSSNDSEDIKSALIELLKLIRSWDKQLVSPMLKSVLPDVLQQLRHNEATIRCLAARSLREISSSHPDAYRGDLRSFILPLFETESDSQKEVAKTAEECCTIVSQTLSADEMLPIVATMVGEPSYPVNVSAIKMLNVICDNNCDSHTILKHINAVVTNLLLAYDHNESSARKAAVFCLVSVHNLAGADVVTPYFKDLAGSKFKLLNLYIRRSQTTNI